jgi:hypothetical protein
VSAIIFLEGGGDSEVLRSRCRQGFRTLLERCGLDTRKFRLIARGGRNSVYDDFKTAHESAPPPDFVAMLIDSEDPIRHLEKPWTHLATRDGWSKPKGADDDQVLLMVTCMETWIVTDHKALEAHFGAALQQSALPALSKMETRARDAVQKGLVRATRNCKNAYAKGKRSFEILGKLDPEALAKHLPSFARVRRILDEKL